MNLMKEEMLTILLAIKSLFFTSMTIFGPPPPHLLRLILLSMITTGDNLPPDDGHPLAIWPTSPHRWQVWSPEIS